MNKKLPYLVIIAALMLANLALFRVYAVQQWDSQREVMRIIELPRLALFCENQGYGDCLHWARSQLSDLHTAYQIHTYCGDYAPLSESFGVCLFSVIRR